MGYVEYGTELMRLKPSSILGAARADIERYHRNTSPTINYPQEYYAFHRNDVHRGMSGDDAGPRKIIRMALQNLDRGRASGKRNTVLLYANPDLLEQAVALPED